MRMSFALAVSLLAPALGAVAPEGSGPQDPYLGQALPGSKPEVFAPGIVSTDGHEFACSFTPDGREFYFTRRAVGAVPTVIMVSRLVDGSWTPPAPVPFNNAPGQMSFEPQVTPDGSWGEPKAIDLGMTAGAPTVSPDGRFLFFSGGKPPAGDIYWVSASVLGAGARRD